jgi:3-oxoadipate enol-lactonase
MTIQRRMVRGTRLAFVDRGRGTPVLLIHGFPLDHTMWDPQVEALAAGHRVLVPDLRGFGQSETGGEKTTMEELADDLAGVLNELGVDEPVVVCGLSMGGYVVFQFWRRYADRVRGLILCDTRAAPDSAEAASARLLTADRVLREGPAFLARSMLPKLLAASTFRREPALVEAIRVAIERADPRGVAAASRGMAERPDVTGLLPCINCPTLVVVGAEDAISPPAEMRAMAAAIPASRFVEIAAAGHMSPMEQPDEVSAAMGDFLAGL